jgi:3-hydroxyisobutyrate dehydrogenase
MTVGFIGLGNLGRAMAGRLIAQGENLVVWNRSKQKSRDFKAVTAESPASLISKAEMVFLCLSDSNAVKAVLESPNGILSCDCAGKIIIDTTTNHFDSVLHFHRQLTENGASYLESPVLGSIIPASHGNLTILVSGDIKSYNQALPLLQKIGNKIFFLERPSLATKMKLVNNFVLGSFMATIAEALALGEALGARKEMVLDILASGAGNSTILNNKREKLLAEDFSPHFSMAMIHKDLQYLEDMAASIHRPLFNAIVARELFAQSIPAQMEELDFSAVYKIIKGLQ